uniref:Uncharacterized protein n=1 Tax=Cannabis sativa TaxID=3483 RepID=A0A803R416_CANSA
MDCLVLNKMHFWGKKCEVSFSLSLRYNFSSLQVYLILGSANQTFEVGEIFPLPLVLTSSEIWLLLL